MKFSERLLFVQFMICVQKEVFSFFKTVFWLYISISYCNFIFLKIIFDKTHANDMKYQIFDLKRFPCWTHDVLSTSIRRQLLLELHSKKMLKNSSFVRPSRQTFLSNSVTLMTCVNSSLNKIKSFFRIAQLTFTCSKLAKETLEKSVKYVQS